MIISFNPTLSLSSLAVGYKAPIAACFMMIVGIIWANTNTTFDKKFWLNVAYVGGWFALATFMQPRFLLIAIIIAVFWALKVVGRKNQIRIAAFVISIMMVAPAIMIFRNIEFIDKATISTNLGVTMRIGAGPETSGGYDRSGPEVPCEPQAPATTVTDNELVICVLKWYLDNPVPSLELFIKKFFFHWSPWFGPLSNGTMLRNPWLQVHPFAKTVEMQEGFAMVYGNLGRLFPGEWIFGSLISWVWILGSLGFLAYGFIALRRRGGPSTFLAWALLIPVLLNTASSIGTIGDHRFRIPTLTLSLVLQLFGAYALFSRKSFRRGIDGPVRLARGLNWKGGGQGDNLQP
jgi:hypothetical protein